MAAQLPRRAGYRRQNQACATDFGEKITMALIADLQAPAAKASVAVPKSSAKRLRICHIITRMIVGGAQENTLLSMRGLLEKGHAVTLITGPSEGPEGQLLATMPLPGLQIHEEPLLRRRLAPLADWQALRALTAYLRRQDFDVVHTHSSKAGILGRLAAWRAEVPLVVHTVHGQAFHAYQCWWRNQLYITAERLAARRCHRIFAVAQAMIDQCVAARVAPASMYEVVYSGMELEPYLNAQADLQLRRQLGIDDDAIVIGKVARLFELKGHDLLVAAAADVVQAYPKVRFLLVGDGMLRAELERAFAARGIADKVIFAGLVPPALVPRYMALMDILVHLSLREGLPRTVVQALASAVPAVAFDLDGTPEVIIDGKTGRLCPPQDALAVRDALLELIGDPQLRQQMGSCGRDLVRQKFEWRMMADHLENAYQEALVARLTRA